MITIETVVAMAVRDRTVLDHLGEALRSDLVVANPFLRAIATFADDFALTHRALPAAGDWDLWLQSLHEGMERDGTREAYGQLLTHDLSGYTPSFFTAQVQEQLQLAAVQVAKARLNTLAEVPLDAFRALAEQIERIRVGGVQGLARLADLDVWAHPHHEEERAPTGFPALDKMIGGWGHELWIMFADSGMGKSMLLQNCASNLARAGKRVLHVTLELGIRPQISRYYRQLAASSRAEFNAQPVLMRQKLEHWFRLAQGEIFLLEFPAYSVEPDQLKRTIERVGRTIGDIDVLVLDYLDLLTLPVRARAGRGYEDLGRITHEVRGLCPGFDLTVLTASQAVRRPEHADRLTIRDMGDSYNKVRGADGLLSLVQTPLEAETFQGRLGVLKTRDSGGMGTEVPLYINRELSLIQDLDHPNTVALMRRLGHVPAAPAPPKGNNTAAALIHGAMAPPKHGRATGKKGVVK
jgi:hypothetical protein